MATGMFTPAGGVPAVFRAEGNADCLCLVTMLPTLLNTRIV